MNFEYLAIYTIASFCFIGAYNQITESKENFRWILKLAISASLIAGFAIFFETAISKFFNASTLISLCLIVPVTEEFLRLIILEYLNVENSHSAFKAGYFIGFFETILFIAFGMCNTKLLVFRFFFTQSFHGIQAVSIHKKTIFIVPAIIFHSSFNYASTISGKSGIVLSLLAFWISMIFAIFSKKTSKL